MKRHWITFPGAMSVLLVLSIGVFAVLTAFLLDIFAIRLVDGGSITTMFPGFVYANALILKVTLFEAILLAAYSIANRMYYRWRKKEASATPVWGNLSLLLPTTAPLVGALVILVAQTLTDTPAGFSLNYFTQFSRMAVLSMMGIIAIADLFAIVSLVRREKPIGVAVISLAVTIVYWVLFRYWEFYRLGFDQDRWNDI